MAGEVAAAPGVAVAAVAGKPCHEVVAEAVLPDPGVGSVAMLFEL
jgi:hypothetical protein